MIKGLLFVKHLSKGIKHGVLFIILGIFLLPNPDSLKAATGLTIQPIKISQNIDPGKIISGTINLSNASDEDIVVEVNVEDFLPSAGTNSLNFIGRAPGVTSVRDWITVNTDKEFLFERGGKKAISYTINVPPNAEPGGHFGVIFFKAISKSDAAEQLKIGTQVGVLTLVTVNGDYEQSGKILDIKVPSFVSKAPVPFTIKFENTGTVHFEPKGEITIKNIFGKTVGQVPIEGQVLLPTGVKDLEFSWNPEGVVLGRYTANINISEGPGLVIAEKQVSFYAVPIWYTMIFIIVLLFVWAILRFLRSKVSISLKK